MLSSDVVRDEGCKCELKSDERQIRREEKEMNKREMIQRVFCRSGDRLRRGMGVSPMRVSSTTSWPTASMHRSW